MMMNFYMYTSLLNMWSPKNLEFRGILPFSQGSNDADSNSIDEKLKNKLYSDSFKEINETYPLEVLGHSAGSAVLAVDTQEILLIRL